MSSRCRIYCDDLGKNGKLLVDSFVVISPIFCVTGWEMIRLLIFLLAAGFGDTRNPSNASLFLSGYNLPKSAEKIA